jgi:hypothetical protein
VDDKSWARHWLKLDYRFAQMGDAKRAGPNEAPA